MNEIIEQVKQRAGLDDAKARTAVETVVNYLKQHLPGPVAGQLDSFLQGGTSGIAGEIGNILGKKSA